MLTLSRISGLPLGQLHRSLPSSGPPSPTDLFSPPHFPISQSHPDYDSSIKTISRALKPATGVLCLLWNLEDESRPSHPWVGPFRARYQQHEASSPQYRLNLWHAAFSTPAYTSDFADRESTFFRSERETSVQTAVDRVLSKSYTTVLPEGEKDQLKSELRALLEADGSGVQWVDRDARTFLYPYATEVVICRKK